MPQYRFGTGNTHIKAKLKNFDWSLDKDRSKLWDTKYGGLAPQVLLKPGWRGNFFTGGKDGEVQVRRLPQERSWLASAPDFYEKGSEENSSETQNSNTNQEHRVHSARGKGGSPRKRGMKNCSETILSQTAFFAAHNRSSKRPLEDWPSGNIARRGEGEEYKGKEICPLVGLYPPSPPTTKGIIFATLPYHCQAGHWVDIIDHWSIIDHFA